MSDVAPTEGRAVRTGGRPHQGTLMPLFEVARRSIKGARSYQEDTALVWPDEEAFAPAGTSAADGSERLAVLADGMGGHTGGALASRMACETFLNICVGTKADNRERLTAALEAANAAIADAVAANPLLDGMGSTLVGVLFGPQGVEWVSVGDSPLMLYRNGEIAFLNEDHSLAPDLDRAAAQGLITAEEARRDPRRHMLRSAVTGDEIDLVDLSQKPLRLEPGDYVLLASDGIQTLESSEIERIVMAYANDGAAAVAHALIRGVEAMRDPHQDNTTIVVVRAV